MENNIIRIYARYSNSDYGNIFKDDCNSRSLRPDVVPEKYSVNGNEFSSPEEAFLWIQTAYDGTELLELDMNNRESAKFIKLWQDTFEKQA